MRESSLVESPGTAAPTTHITATSGWIGLRLDELWQYRELIYFFIWRDIKVRYKQTILGAAWAILQPLITMVIFTLFFGKLAKMPSDGIPYPIFSYAALVPWTFFSNGVSKASSSLVGGGGMLKKIYFPRMVLPIASVTGGFVDFVLAFSVMILLMIVFGVTPTLNIIWLPFLLVLAWATALGVSLWFTSLNVLFRDVRYVVPFIIQAWLFATPVVYPASLIENPMWRAVFALNPMVGVVEGFRWALLGTDTAPGPLILISAIVALVLLVSGAFYFRRMERTFADVV
jgi:lipopolysaccharide transport system permease protein